MNLFVQGRISKITVPSSLVSQLHRKKWVFFCETKSGYDCLFWFRWHHSFFVSTISQYLTLIWGRTRAVNCLLKLSPFVSLYFSAPNKKQGQWDTFSHTLSNLWSKPLHFPWHLHVSPIAMTPELPSTILAPIKVAVLREPFIFIL